MSERHVTRLFYAPKLRLIGSQVASTYTHLQLPARDMLRSHYGASTSSRALRRPISTTMNPLERTTSLPKKTMGTTMASLRGGQSASARASPPSLHRMWQPTRGILFASSSNPGSFRTFVSSTKVMAEKDKPVDEEENAKSPESENLPSNQEENEQIQPDLQSMPETTFTYKMSEDLFRAAQKANPLSPESYWLHTLYRGPNDEGEPKKVLVHYCQSKHTTERVLQKYFMDQRVIGFDIEWKMEATKFSGPKKNVSLIQIACEERVALLHVAVYAKEGVEDLVAPSLKKIMEDPEISKVGVSIKADCTRLRKYLDINSKGLFELSHLFKLVKYSESKDFKLVNKKLVSLATQVQEHLQLPMFKGEVRSSDWSKKLNMDQITYAAADSYAGLQLYDIMDLKRKALDPAPPRPYHADLNKPIRLAEGVELPVDEGAEELDPDDAEPPLKTTLPETHLPISEVESDPDFDGEFEPSQEFLTPPSSPSATRASKTRSTSAPATASSAKPSRPMAHPLLQEAETRLSTYRTSTSTSTTPHRATPANLRAYFLWYHNPTLTLSEVAAILRTPPLQTRTVSHYILEAVKLESLQYDRERAREVLKVWKASGGAKGMIAKRYWRLEKDVGYVDED